MTKEKLYSWKDIRETIFAVSAVGFIIYLFISAGISIYKEEKMTLICDQEHKNNYIPKSKCSHIKGDIWICDSGLNEGENNGDV